MKVDNDLNHQDALSNAREKVDLTKLNILNNSVIDGTKTREEALDNLKDIASGRVSSVVLAAAVMRAEDFTVLPRENGKTEETNPNLVPRTAKVISNALANPNRNRTVLDVSQAAMDHLIECSPVEHAERVTQCLAPQREAVAQILTQLPPRGNRSQAAPTVSNVVCSTKYMGARAADLVKDENGSVHFVPRNVAKTSTVKDVNLDLMLKSKQKEGY